MFLYMGMDVPQLWCGSQRTTSRSQFSSTMWVSEIKLSSLGKTLGAFTC